RYAVIFYWPLYIVGAAMLVPGTRIMTVAGIATLFGLVLFMITALIFSVATYNLMRSKSRGSSSPSIMVSFGKPGSFMRAFRLPAHGRKSHSTRSSQASRAAVVED
ncbi:MAG TPA: hypothetical protein PKL26_00510, partial [Methanolinea sp.]|nr:hypothetical protein [Methanolinea sp.]